MTCAHVVADAVGISRDEPTPPQQTISVDFPLVDDNRKCTAEVVVWLPSRDGTDDITVLELNETAPESTTPANLVEVDDWDDLPVTMLGYPFSSKQSVQVIRAKGKTIGTVGQELIQINALEGNKGYFAERGFSGSPVFSSDGALVGMIVSAEADPTIQAGFMIRTRILQRFVQAKRIGLQDIGYMLATVQNDLAPLLDSLGENELAKQIEKQCQQIEENLHRSQKTPIALIGTTGAGKTTLINAIIGQELGATAGVGSQSTNLLTLEAGREDYLVEIDYSDLEEITSLIQRARAESQPDPTLRTDLQGISSDLQHILTHILKHPEKSIDNLSKIISSKSQRVLPSSLKPEVKKRVQTGHLSISFENTPTGLKSLGEFVFEHTNTGGKFGSITREVKVRGPFTWLQDGIIIQDLPGLGDINPNRIHRTTQAVKNALQVVLVVDAKGIKDDVKEMLYQSNLINYMLSNIQLQQIMIVGTHLDDIYLNETELAKLGFSLGDKPSGYEILIAKYEIWKQLVMSQWRTLLYTYQNERKSKTQNMANIERLVSSTYYIPTSPKGYLTLEGILTGIPDPKYKLIHPNDDIESTGIPAVRSAMSSLASNQVHLYWRRILDHVSKMIDLILSNGKVTVQILVKDIQSNEHDTRLMTSLVKASERVLTKKVHYKIKTDLVKAALKNVSPIKEIMKLATVH